MDQRERDLILSDFRSGSIRMLITHTLGVPYFDVQKVALVINYDLPFNREHYIDRIGRRGRFNPKSVAINFLTNDDVPLLKDIEDFYGITVEELPLDISDLL